jgi:hypothetical protein
LDAQNGLTFTGTARRRFSPLSAGSSVLDAVSRSREFQVHIHPRARVETVRKRPKLDGIEPSLAIHDHRCEIVADRNAEQKDEQQNITRAPQMA